MTKKQLQTGIAVVAALGIIWLFFINGNLFSMNQPSSGAGLVMQDEVVGTGPAAKAGDTITANYTGKLDNGTVFDTSVGRGPITFVLGTGQVIPGWDQGLVGMQAGGKRILIIPPQLAYGSQGIGPIPPNATLTFEVELVSITPASSTPQ